MKNSKYLDTKQHINMNLKKRFSMPTVGEDGEQLEHSYM